MGGSDDNFTNTCFSQAASQSILAGAAPFTGTWKPMNSLGFCNNGQNGNGVWKLHIFDVAAQDQGTLLNWQISFGANAPVVAPFTSSNLPIVVINTNNVSIPDQPKIIANMGIIYNGFGNTNHTNDPYNNYNGKIAIELRGSSSQSFPKKSYGFETRSKVNTSNDTDAVLLGMPAESDWVLSANYTDKSFMNNVLAYRLFQAFGGYAPRTQYVELVINNQYQGIYVLMEKIKRDSNRVDISKLSASDTSGSALTGGYILKIDKTTGSGGSGFTSAFLPDVSTNGQTIFFQYDYPKEGNIVQAQKNYIKKFVDSFENALYNIDPYDTTIGWRRFASEKSFVRYLILNEVAKNVDGYRLSTYLYKKRDTKGNKLFVGPPWDYDIAFYNADYCGGNVDTGWAFNFGQECGGDGFQVPFWWKKLMKDTLFANNLQCTYSQLRQTFLDTNQLFTWIDSTAAYLNAAQTRNFEYWPILGIHVWPNPNPQPISYAGEIEELKSWLRRRLAWLDANIPGTCYPTNSIMDLPGKQIAAYPNPFADKLQLKLPSAGKYSLVLTAIDGKVIFRKEGNANLGETITLDKDLAQLVPGLYLMQVHSNFGISNLKLQKQ